MKTKQPPSDCKYGFKGYFPNGKGKLMIDGRQIKPSDVGEDNKFLLQLCSGDKSKLEYWGAILLGLNGTDWNIIDTIKIIDYEKKGTFKNKK